MGNFYDRPAKTGPNPYTRSGEAPPKLSESISKGQPAHRVNNAMSLELHMGDERVRTAGLSPAEREWRKKYLHDQLMHPDEPIHVDAVHRQMNPFRMLYRTPWDKIYMHFLLPSFGPYYGTVIRTWAPKLFIYYFGLCYAYYYIKYEIKNWEKMAGLITMKKKDFYSSYKDGHNQEDLKLAHSRPDLYNFLDREYVHQIQAFDIGQTKRPW